MKPQIIILGAGISGLSLAWRLSSQGVHVSVLESSKTIGGLAGTHRESSYCMDIGPHSLFSEDTEILNTILRLFDDTLIAKPRNVKFYFKGKYLDYPLTAQSVLFQMGMWSGLRVGLSYLKSKAFTKKPKSIGCHILQLLSEVAVPNNPKLSLGNLPLDNPKSLNGVVWPLSLLQSPNICNDWTTFLLWNRAQGPEI